MHDTDLPTISNIQLLILTILSEKQTVRFSNPEDYVKFIRHVAIYQYGQRHRLCEFETHYNELIASELIEEPRRYMPKGMITQKGLLMLKKMQNTEQYAFLQAQKKDGECPVFDPLSDCT